jgi:hypothetical protein
MAKIRHKKITNFCYITKLEKKKTPSFLEASYRRCPFDTVAQLGQHEASCGRFPFDAVINLVDRKRCPFAAVVNLVVSKHLAHRSYHAKEREREREREEGRGGEERTTPCRKGRWELKQKLLPNKKLQFSNELAMASMALMCVIARLMYHCLERLADFVLEFY